MVDGAVTISRDDTVFNFGVLEIMSFCKLKNDFDLSTKISLRLGLDETNPILIEALS